MNTDQFADPSNDLDRELDGLEASARDLLERCARVRALKRASLPTSPNLPDDLIKAAEACKIARCEKSTMTRWCKAWPLESDSGFAIKLCGRWHVAKSAFLAWLAVRPT